MQQIRMLACLLIKKKKKKSSAGMDFQLSLCFEKLIWAMWLLAGSWHMSLTGCFVFFFFSHAKILHYCIKEAFHSILYFEV